MGKLTVVTWNSAGESRRAAQRLADALAELGRAADVIVVQGVHARPGGPVYQMLAGLGPRYHPAPAHAAGGGVGDSGYLLQTRIGVDGQESFRRTDLAADPGVRHWMDGLPARDRASAEAELAGMVMPATAALRVGATTVRLLTWRGTDPDRLRLYQRSALAAAGHAHGVDIMAGDLGVTAETFNAEGPTGCLLPGYGGVASGLQHIIGHGRTDACLPIATAEYVPIPGHAHAVLCATATWPARRTGGANRGNHRKTGGTRCSTAT